MPFRPSITLLCTGRRSRIGAEEGFREKINVFGHSSGSWQSFSISARQLVLWYALDVLVGARCLGKFVWYRICVGQGRVVGVNFVVGRILLGHDESGPMLDLKLLVGHRWREFHCLAAPPRHWRECGL